jgi:hypothetical protein
MGGWAAFAVGGAGAAYLALRYWHGFSVWLICLLFAAGLASGIWLITGRVRNPAWPSGVTAGISYVVWVLFWYASIVYGDRFFGEHHVGPRILFWGTLAAGGVIFGAAVLLTMGANEVTETRTSRTQAAEDARVTRQMLERRWFSQSEDLPDFMEPLFAMPAIRGFGLRTSSGAVFKYAVAAGARVLLVAMLGSAEDRPELEAAAASWRTRLAAEKTTVKVLLVAPGYELPPLRSDELFGLTANMTTTLAFVDTVGHWLDYDNRVILPTVRTLLSAT